MIPKALNAGSRESCRWDPANLQARAPFLDACSLLASVTLYVPQLQGLEEKAHGSWRAAGGAPAAAGAAAPAPAQRDRQRDPQHCPQCSCRLRAAGQHQQWRPLQRAQHAQRPRTPAGTAGHAAPRERPTSPP
eukprot:scaffold188549_cov14-Tisochrysis_lutea.AAC.1